MIFSRPLFGTSLRKKLGRFGYFIFSTMWIGSLYGIATFYAKIPSFSAELVFVLLTLGGTRILFRNKAFLCAMIAGTSAIVLLYAIVLVGTAPSDIRFHRWFPSDVFIEPLKSQAVHVLLVFTCVFTGISLLRIPLDWQWPPCSPQERAFARLFLWPSLVVSLVLTVINTRGPLITEAAYYSGEYIAMGGGPDESSLKMLSLFLMVFSVIASLRGYGLKHQYVYWTIGVISLSTIYFHLLRGSRRVTLSMLILFLLLYYLVSKSKNKVIVLVVLSLVGVFVLQVWTSVRWEAASIGLWSAISRGFHNRLVNLHKGSLTDITRFPVLFWNLLNTMDLYSMGIRRNGKTYINLIPQSIPGPVANAIGYTRPLAEPGILAQYRPHGGAIFSVAEAFWNFGLPSVIGYAILLAWILTVLERFYRRLDPIFSYGYFSLSLLIVATFLTGTQALVRTLQISLLITGIGWIIMYVNARPLRKELKGVMGGVSGQYTHNSPSTH